MPALRRIADSAVLLLIGGLFCETWFVGGLLTSYVVATGSMAPSLLGPHCQLTCPHCGNIWNADSKGVSEAPILTCPNCGHPARREKLNISPTISGDRVFVDRTVCGLGSLRRWDIVAFGHPERSHELAVKRLAGFPGETIQITGGDVYVNGAIARKSLKQFLAMAVPVHRTFPASEQEEPPVRGWIPECKNSRWTARRDGRLIHSADRPASASKAVDWLTFHFNKAERRERVPDLLGYNSGEPRREETVNAVPDVGVMFKLNRTEGSEKLRIQIGPGATRFELCFDFVSQEAILFRGEHEMQRVGINTETDAPIKVIFAVFDRQVAAMVDQGELFVLPYPDGDGKHAPQTMTLKIGIDNGPCELSDIRVFRDVYYDCPRFRQHRWGCEKAVILDENSYYCLGDNSFVSEDSRTWDAGPDLPKTLILGRIITPLTRGDSRVAR